MIIDDLTIEVRDANLVRVGQITPGETDLTLTDTFNGVGEWQVKLPAEHPLATALRAPGAGIVISNLDGLELFSGPMQESENAATADDPIGGMTFKGVTDSIILADALAYPDPANADPETQSRARDTRTGPAETVMREFVDANIGPSAPPERRGALASQLVVPLTSGLGEVTTKSARFDSLGKTVGEIATSAGLGFRVIQRGDELHFEVYAVRDLSDSVRLDVENNTLAGHRVSISPPEATRAIVGGAGQETRRKFVSMTTAAATAAESGWGRIIETFVDQRNTKELAELEQAGREALEDADKTALAVQVTPMEDLDDDKIRFGRDWRMGDKIGVVVEDQELPDVATGWSLVANTSGLKTGVLLGDPVGFDLRRALQHSMTKTERRVAQLERSAERGAIVLLASEYSNDTPPSAYPEGDSTLSVASAPEAGWPFEGAGVLSSVSDPETGLVAQTWHIAAIDDVVEDLEDGDLAVTIQTGSNNPWTISTEDPHDGLRSLHSPALTMGEECWTTIAIPAGAKRMSCWLKTQVGAEHDEVEVLIDGILVYSPRTTPWTERSFDVEGATVVKIVYRRDILGPPADPGFVVVDTISFEYETGLWIRSGLNNVWSTWKRIPTDGQLKLIEQEIADIKTGPRVEALPDGKLPADLPSSYPLGVSTARADSADGWPDNGVLITHMHSYGYDLGNGLFSGASYQALGSWRRDDDGFDAWGNWYSFALAEDTTPSAQGTIPITAETGWEIGSALYMRTGRRIDVKIHVIRRGADIVAGSNSNIPDADGFIGTITDPTLRPVWDMNPSARLSDCGGDCDVKTTGEFVLVDMPSGGVLNTDENLYMTATWITP